ncbi:hypothetical protein HLRTI_002152 [Halorhabdus tiamatea SARL4B]|uniref:Uncharacterized protein n=1 Tax=Halorhabdus tiamatea SARL4B TaxID=1033806 RepID=U2FBG6_9EURY|nr:hypothetical protein [Halorhabdus tiamatea]ERJ05764.1 hypothetical protein HLRTI_002152 [Halorhabdus tiamatea SARL4B]
MQDTNLYQFTDLESLETLYAWASEAIEQEENPVRSLTFIAEEKPKQIFASDAPTGFSVEIEDREDFFRLDLTRRIKGSGEEYNEDGYKFLSGSVYIFNHNKTQAYTAFSVSDREFFNQAVRRYIQALPPSISTSFLSTDELQQLLNKLNDEINGNLYVTKGVTKSPSGDTEVKYFDNSRYFELFNTEEVSQQNYYVDKIEFELRQANHEFQGQISRKGASRYVSGSESIYFNKILPNFATLLSEKGDLFNDKAREYGSREAETIEITYEEGSIKGREENVRLINALEGLKRSSITVYHKNPYMHASVLDYEDGTNADVFLTSDRRVSIVPGFNASRKALSRICNRINQGFLEGTVSEGKERSKDPEKYFVQG